MQFPRSAYTRSRDMRADSSSHQMSQQLVHRNFDQQCHLFRQQRYQLETSQEYIHKTVEQNTKQELADVKQAVERLNKKVDAVMRTPQIQEEKRKIEEADKQIQLTMQQAMQTFEEGRRTIQARGDLTPEQKERYTESLYQKIMGKLYTQEEMQEFERMFQNMVVMVPGHKALMGASGPNTPPLAPDHVTPGSVSPGPVAPGHVAPGRVAPNF